MTFDPTSFVNERGSFQARPGELERMATEASNIAGIDDSILIMLETALQQKENLTAEEYRDILGVIRLARLRAASAQARPAGGRNGQYKRWREQLAGTEIMPWADWHYVIYHSAGTNYEIQLPDNIQAVRFIVCYTAGLPAVYVSTGEAFPATVGGRESDAIVLPAGVSPIYLVGGKRHLKVYSPVGSTYTTVEGWRNIQ